MDVACIYEEKTAIHELTQGLEFAKQLTVHPHAPETRDFLIQEILSSYHNALFILQSLDSAGQPPAPALPAASLPESYCSPGSEEFKFNQPFSIQQGQNVSSRKRKGSTTWEDHVRICSGNGLEDGSDDGFNWRKYGQKVISGAKFTRSYYRCSYRKVQKCLATKQVQRRDEDPTMFDVAYKGKHTCVLGCQSASPPPEIHEIIPTNHHQISPPNPDEMVLNLRPNLSVVTSDLGGYTDTVPSLFSFPSTSSGLMEDIHQYRFPNRYDDELWQVCSPFISPANSESYFCTEWGSSSSLDLLAGPADVDSDILFIDPLF